MSNREKIDNEDFLDKNSMMHSTKLKDGHGLLAFLHKVVRENPKKLFKVSLNYQLLSGKNLQYYKTSIFRTKNFIGTGEFLKTEIASWLETRGEIYFPDDPFKISCNFVKIWVSDMQFEPSKSPQSRHSEGMLLRNTMVKRVSVKSILDGLYYKEHKAYVDSTDKHRLQIPSAFLRLGFKNMRDVREAPVMVQFDIIKNFRRPSSIYTREIKLLFSEDELKYLSHKEVQEKAIFYVRDELYLIDILNFSEVDCHQREVLPRKLEQASRAIYVTYDAEWNWSRKEGGDLEVWSPQTISFCVFRGGTSSLPKLEAKTYSGEDCMERFLTTLLHFRDFFKTESVYAIAHNASKVEHHFMIGAITKFYDKKPNYEIQFTHVDGPHLFSFSWKGIEFRDSLLFVPLSLKAAGEAFGLQYKKLDISEDELLKFNWNSPCALALKYSQLDVLSLSELVYKFNKLASNAIDVQDPLNLFSFRSAASFMKWFLTTSKIDHLSNISEPDAELRWDSEDMALLRQFAYLGGRCECFFLGHSDKFKRSFSSEFLDSAFALKIDIISSYPNSMVRNPIPGRVKWSTKLGSLKELLRMLDGSASGRIYFIKGLPKFKKKMKFPLIGVRDEDKLIFPNFMSGERLVGIWDFELLAIREYLEDISEIEIIAFDPYYGFSRKIEDLFMKRKVSKEEGNDGLAFTYKILMNSGYGSLGLNNRREVSYLAKGSKLTDRLRCRPNNTVMEGPNGFNWVVTKEISEVNSMIFAAGYITARARFFLWEELEHLYSSEGAEPIYCDTDSIIFVDRSEKEGYYKVKYRGSGLGSWKLEGTASSWEVAGLKVYRFGYEVKYKGICAPAHELLTAEGLITDRIKMRIWSCGRDGSLTFEEREKKMNFDYSKGMVSLSGKIFPLDI